MLVWRLSKTKATSLTSSVPPHHVGMLRDPLADHADCDHLSAVHFSLSLPKMRLVGPTRVGEFARGVRKRRVSKFQRSKQIFQAYLFFCIFFVRIKNPNNYKMSSCTFAKGMHGSRAYKRTNLWFRQIFNLLFLSSLCSN